ncbi:MAG: FG-GAP-like repeat-containing protein [Bacteroidales bacterium]|nr:FG-GAP-like repeat-containing protein [Bacteroidales bacterium]
MKRIFFTLVSGCILFSAFQVKAQCCDFAHQQQVEPPTSAATFGVALGDLDNDGDLDAVSISAYYGVDVYHNNGSGTFTLSGQYATGSNGDFYGVHIADVNGDNLLDIIAIPFYSSSSLTILINNGMGGYSTTITSSNIAAHNAAIGDVDGDGDVDLFIPASSASSGKLFKNNGFGTFTLAQTISGAVGHDAEMGDLDGDGDLDLFITKNSSTGISIFLNDGTGNFSQSGTNFSSSTTNVALGDLDNDGDLDAWVGTSGSQTEIYLNDGSAAFTLDTTLTTNSYCKAVELYDLNNDGVLKAFMSFYSGHPQVWTALENMDYTLCYQGPVGSSSHGMALGDVNADGNMDMYVGHFSNSSGDYVFLNSSPSISYDYTEYCFDYDTAQTVTLNGTTGGSFYSIPQGLNIDIVTGTFTPSTSLPGLYQVKYEIPNCAVYTTVKIKSVDTTVILTNDTLWAVQDSAIYQWINCDMGNAIIAGATQAYYVVDTTGNYAVVVTYDGCTDTSGCKYVYIDNTGLAGLENTDSMKVWPNPTSDQIHLLLPEKYSGARYVLYDIAGIRVMEGKVDSHPMSINVQHLAGGMYWFSLLDNPVKPVKIILQR